MCCCGCLCTVHQHLQPSVQGDKGSEGRRAPSRRRNGLGCDLQESTCGEGQARLDIYSLSLSPSERSIA